MSFRISALVAAVAVLSVGSITPAFAQPQVPTRPRYTQFQSVFAPGRSPLVNPGQGIIGLNAPGIGPAGFGPGFGGFAGPQVPGFAFPGQQFVGQNPSAYPQVLPGGLTVNPNLVATGVPARFGYYGYWYGGRSGYYSHWYPNGVSNGYGVLGPGYRGAFGYGGLYGGGLAGTAGITRPTGSVLGTALMGAGAINQMKR